MLRNEAGYTVIAEDANYYELTRPADFVRVTEEISDIDRMSLLKRLNTICDFYVDPYFFRNEIEERVKNITRSMSPSHANFCWDWLERNLV